MRETGSPAYYSTGVTVFLNALNSTEQRSQLWSGLFLLQEREGFELRGKGGSYR